MRSRFPMTLVLLACAGALLWLPGCSEERPRVVFIGIDGATWKVIGPLAERGELPGFRRLAEEGAYMPEFDTMSTTLSPLVWTSVATGRTPEEHGIVGFTSILASDKRIPATSNARRVKALWNVAGDYGRSAGVIGWWASWPAEHVDGYVVTDHANPAATDWMVQDERYWTADADLLGRLQLDFLPPDLAPVLEEAWLDKARFPWAELQRRSALDPEQMDLLREAPWNERTPYSWLKTFYAIDYPLFRVSRRLARERPTDLQMLYLRGPDPVQHYAWDLVEPDAFLRPPAHLERDRGLVEGVYRYLDSFLLEVLESKDPSTVLIVASDHGAEPSPDARMPGFQGRPGEHSTAAKGVLFLHGPGVRRGHRIRSASPLDLMPTMAWLLGIPVSEELSGQVITEAFEDRFVADHAVRSVDSYGGRETSPGLESPIDEALLEQLRSLGYL